MNWAAPLPCWGGATCGSSMAGAARLSPVPVQVPEIGWPTWWRLKPWHRLRSRRAWGSDWLMWRARCSIASHRSNASSFSIRSLTSLSRGAGFYTTCRWWMPAWSSLRGVRERCFAICRTRSARRAMASAPPGWHGVAMERCASFVPRPFSARRSGRRCRCARVTRLMWSWRRMRVRYWMPPWPRLTGRALAWPARARCGRRCSWCPWQ